MSPTAVKLARVDARPTAVIAQATTWPESPSLWGRLLDEVYRFVRGRPDLATGSGGGQWQKTEVFWLLR